jgi:hypothetical protein
MGGPFYPAGTKPGDYLAHFCTEFAPVEATSTERGLQGTQLLLEDAETVLGLRWG